MQSIGKMSSAATTGLGGTTAVLATNASKQDMLNQSVI